MKIRLALALLAFACSGSAVAAEPTGVWALKAEGTTLCRFEISKTAGNWNAVWVRPTVMRTDGYTVFAIQGPAIRRTASKVSASGDTLDLTFDDPQPGGMPDVFRIHVTDDTHATEEYLALNSEPFVLVRESADASLGGWDPQKTYTLPIEWPTNAEMTAIFDADQTARKTWSAQTAPAISDDDRKRRARTAELLKAGALHSADDFYHAAFVYQHGDTPDDFLLAHVLATVSLARGKTEADWIAAATLDRYLTGTNQPQIFGTQSRTPFGGKTTRDPCNCDLIPNALRTALHVPPVAQSVPVKP